MSTRVTLEHTALEDPRFAILADILGLAHVAIALWFMVRLWRRATESQHYTVSFAVIRAELGAGGVAALVDADLGELVDAHLPTAHAASLELRAVPARPGEQLVRLRGTKGRIEWWGRDRAAKRDGGRTRARQADRSANGKFRDNRSSSIAGDELERSSQVQPADEPAAPQDLSSGSESDQTQQQQQEGDQTIGGAAAAAIAQLHAERFEHVCRDLGIPAPPLRRATLKLAIAERMAEFDTADAADRGCRAAIAALEVEAREKRTAKWFTEGMWKDRRFRAALENARAAAPTRMPARPAPWQPPPPIPADKKAGTPELDAARRELGIARTA
jgi:hypothetical protein